MDALFSNPDVAKEALRQGGGWAVALFMFIVWRRSEQATRRREQQQNRHLKTFEQFAREAIRNADCHYGKRRQLDQLLAEALAQVRIDDGRELDQHLAKALAHVERNGDDA